MNYNLLPGSNRSFSSEKGVSIFELLIVIIIGTIMATFSIFYFSGHSRLFKPDEESLKLIDLLQEARQRSLTQRETIRVEIDVTDNVARLIDENTAATQDDDKKIREITLFTSANVKLDSQPPDITTAPEVVPAQPIADFKQSIYPPSVTHRVVTFRFMKDGTVYDAGTNPVGANANLTGATMYIWSPKLNSTTVSEFARAITIVGTTGSIKMWEYDRALTTANKWKDSRRTGVYGQTGNSNSN